MQKTKDGRIVETATEARGAERGPSMLIVLVVSTAVAAAVLLGLWFFAVI
jgi:hypothetical protein